MNLIKSTPGFETITSIEYQPTISIVMPFSPMTSRKEDMESRMNFITGKVESMLVRDYTAQKAMPVIHKLKSVFKSLNYYTPKKSIVIFLSPFIERILYLDMEMEENVSIDPSYKISNIVENRKELKDYLVLLLSESFSKMYLGRAGELKLIKSNTLVDAMDSFGTARFAPYPPIPGVQRRIQMDKFLRQMDVGLSIMVKSYPLPVFVVGPAELVAAFNGITRNSDFIVEYVQGNFEVASGCDLLFVVRNYLNNWKLIQRRFLINQLEGGRDQHKLHVGLKEAWKAAFRNNVRLLVIEKNYSDFINPDELPNGDQRIRSRMKSLFFIKDDVDELVDRVLDYGGEVCTVDEGVLSSYGRIALIQVG